MTWSRPSGTSATPRRAGDYPGLRGVRPGGGPMDLTVLAIAGCPHAALLEERIAAALAGGPPAVVLRRGITDPEEAARAGLHRPPTGPVGGADPFAAPRPPGRIVCPPVHHRPGPPEG